MAKSTDIRPIAAAVYSLPIRTRMPLKFGPEITTEVTCARIRVTVVHGRERARLAAGPVAGLDRGRAQDVQDPDRRALGALLGSGPRHDADGSRPHQSAGFVPALLFSRPGPISNPARC